MRILIVGDVHAKANDLDDCRALGSYIVSLAQEHKPDSVLFMGDQYDTHALVHVEVQRFWIDLFEELRAIPDLIVSALVGNHDMVGNGIETAANAMQAHYDRVAVLNGLNRFGNLAYASYDADVTSPNLNGVKYLFCHHTFDGAKYENGFYAIGGIDPNKVLAKYVISGHIHTPAEFSKVRYVGSPRWLTVSDGSVADRAVFLLDTETDQLQTFLTNHIVRKIYRLDDSPEAPAELPETKPSDRVVVDVRGPETYVKERSLALKAAGAQTRGFPYTESKQPIRESEGLNESWRKYCGMFVPRYDTPKEKLLGKAQEELNVG